MSGDIWGHLEYPRILSITGFIEPDALTVCHGISQIPWDTIYCGIYKA